jgi:membrane fusion protein (multidrug efflux system)
MAAAIVLVAALAGGYIWWTAASRYVSTDDAFIQARFFTVSPKVSGYISDVLVTDNQNVRAGDTLVTIDQRDYKTAHVQSEAQLEQAKASIPNIDAQIAGQEEQITQAQTQIDRCGGGAQIRARARRSRPAPCANRLRHSL